MRRGGGLRSAGTVQPVARVAEPRHDVTVLVELLVDGRGDDGHVGMRGLQCLQPPARGDQADIFHGADADLLEPVERGNGRVAGGEHGAANVTSRSGVAAGILELDARGLRLSGPAY